MDHFVENLKGVLEAINKLIENNVRTVNTTRVRKCNNVKPSDRSKINFIWRSLDVLEREKILEKNGVSKPKTYKIKLKSSIDIDEFIENLNKKGVLP